MEIQSLEWFLRSNISRNLNNQACASSNARNVCQNTLEKEGNSISRMVSP